MAGIRPEVYSSRIARSRWLLLVYGAGMTFRASFCALVIRKPSTVVSLLWLPIL